MKKTTKHEYALTNDDYKALNKLAKVYTKDVIDLLNKRTGEIFMSTWVNRCLLEEILERMGHNALEACDALLAYTIYHHGTLLSEVPGLSVIDGKVYRDGDPVIDEGYQELYEARDKNIWFGEVFNKVFAINENDNETAEETTTESDDGARDQA